MRKWICFAAWMMVFAFCGTAASKEQDTAVIVKGNSQFAFDLYAKLKDKPGNLFFSPYSISTALAMTYAGAAGNTRQQMAATLHFTQSLPAQEFHRLFGQVGETLNRQGRQGDYRLSIANALWLQKDYQFLPDYVKLVESNYEAGLEQVDFITATEPTRQKINQWVEDKTKDKIKELLKPGILSAQSRLVLTNAIYFKGDWVQKFPKDNTKDTPFYINPSDTLNVPMMYHKEKFKFADCGEVLLLELPYQGKSLSMLVLLPKKVDGIGELEGMLNAEQVDQWQKKSFRQEVMVYLPRFKMTSEFALADTLKEMGMTDAFSDAADFSGIAKTKELFISGVVHKAFVEVNEEGTEAAAATGVVMSRTSMPAPPPIFCADHPFVFVIKDNTTDSILFIGRVADPTQTGQ